ncbi:MAG: hypothetical protein AAGF33_05355 [Pseudomonadota bacterium]
MVFGKLTIGKAALHTHNDSYALRSITALSTRRPFLVAGGLISGVSAGFAFSFSDILTEAELLSALTISGFGLAIGVGIGQLTLISRDLRGSPMAESVYGSYRHLNRVRPAILEAADMAKRSEDHR